MRISHTILICLLFTYASTYNVWGQQSQISIEHEYLNRLERHLNRPGVKFHSSVKPYLESEVLDAIPYSAWGEMGITDYNENFTPHKDSIGRVILQKGKEGFRFGIKRGDFLQVQKGKFYLGINPIVDFNAGYDLKTKTSYIGSEYGVHLNSHIGNKVTVGFAYRGLSENNADYIKELASERGVMPGFSKVNWDGTSMRSNDFNGYISYTPAKFINLQAGYGKHFWGDGYRSLFISDYAPSYPYLAVHANFWRIKYSYLFNVMRDGSINNFDGSGFNTKYGAFHNLSIDITDWFEFTFFEGVVWSHGDSSGTRGIELNYLNPVVFLRPIEFAVGSPDNIILGLGMKFKVSNSTNIYTQFMLDDLDIKFARLGKGFYRNKFGIQLGIKSFDLFKVPLLDIQTELNLARPYVYAHKTTAQNYTHMNTPLAHPLGANFLEFIAIARYEKNNFYTSVKFQVAKQGRDNSEVKHSGYDIFRSDFEIDDGALDHAFNKSFLQGEKTNILNTELRLGYRLNPRINLATELIFNYRKLKSDLNKQSNAFIGVGIKSNLFNRYKDF